MDAMDSFGVPHGSRHDDASDHQSAGWGCGGGGPRQVEGPASRTGSAQQLRRAGIYWSAAGIVPDTIPFFGSGAHVAAAEWTRALAAQGSVSSIDLFTPLDRVDWCRQQLNAKQTSGTKDGGSRAAVYPELALPERLQANRYDVLHHPFSFDFLGSTYARSRFSRWPYPITWTQYGISYSYLLVKYFLGITTAQIYPCDAIVCSTAASRWAMGERLKDIVERYSRAWDRPAPRLPRLDLIPLGVDASRFAPQDQTAARRDLDLPLDRPVVLCVGRVQIEDKMDWTPLLLAFRKVREALKRRPILALAGPGTEYSREVLDNAAQLGIGDDVRPFFGSPRICLPSLYAACDVFVSPADSTCETFGLTVAEAMACGRPVVASDWDGYKELIIHGETGFKVRTDWADCLGKVNELAPVLSWEQEHLHAGQSVSVDVGQMASYLVQVLESPELRERMGRRGREQAMALYDWPVVIARWEALWRELSAIARSIEHREQDRLDYLRPNSFRHFSHYASRIIDDSVPVQLAPRSRALLAGSEPLLLYRWAQGFLQPENLRAVLAALGSASWVRAELTVGDLLGALRKSRGLTRDQALMHVMWLAKYDLISLGGAGPPLPIPRAT